MYTHTADIGLMDCAVNSFILRTSEKKNDRLGHIWLKRLEIMSSYISNGTDVLLSDADALWLKGISVLNRLVSKNTFTYIFTSNSRAYTVDPMVDISRYSVNTELVASRGWHPVELSNAWGG